MQTTQTMNRYITAGLTARAENEAAAVTAADFCGTTPAVSRCKYLRQLDIPVNATARELERELEITSAAYSDSRRVLARMERRRLALDKKRESNENAAEVGFTVSNTTLGVLLVALAYSGGAAILIASVGAAMAACNIFWLAGSIIPDCVISRRLRAVNCVLREAQEDAEFYRAKIGALRFMREQALRRE